MAPAEIQMKVGGGGLKWKELKDEKVLVTTDEGMRGGKEAGV